MSENPLDLSGRTILVTGASSGIGRDIAVLFSALGAKVILAGRSEERLQETLTRMSPGAHVAAPFDLSLTDQIVAWVKATATQHGPLDGLVHAAGRQITAPLRALSPSSLDSLLRTNVSSALMLARGFCQKGCNRGGGSIVFLTSVMALVGKPGIAAYSASKAALAGLTRSLALEFAPERIRVNCIAPGFVQTDMLDAVKEALSPELFAALEADHALGFGTPRDVAHAAAFLTADTARWITGSTLVVDGGYTAQ